MKTRTPGWIGASFIAVTALTPAKAQTSAIAVPPPPPIASVPAQPLAPPQVIVPATPPQPAAAGLAAPPYKLVSPQSQGAQVENSNVAEPRWNSGGGGAMPILEPTSPSGHQSPETPPSVPSPPAAVAQTPPDPWLPRQGAVLGVLNKEDGAVSRLAVQVGNSVVQGKLRVTILACVSRPDNVAPDAAVFLSIKNIQQNQQSNNYQASTGAADAQVFTGWLLRSEPGASVVADVTNMFRLIKCGTS